MPVPKYDVEELLRSGETVSFPITGWSMYPFLSDGDIVTVTRYGLAERGHVKGYTDYQIVPTYEWPTRVVSANGLHDGTCKIEFVHCTPVYEV